MAKKLWGGTFGKETNPMVEEFTKSIHYDYKLAQYDLLGSMAHVEILRKSGYLSADEARILQKGLDSLYTRIKSGKINFSAQNKEEDIHTYIQNELHKEIGVLSLKLHTARSRNDQVVFAAKFYAKWLFRN